MARSLACSNVAGINMTRNIVKFRLRPRRRGKKWARRLPQLTITLFVLAGGGLGLGLLVDDTTLPAGDAIACSDPHIIDGDTLDCGGIRIRLAGIDAPEKAGHCREGRKCTPGDPVASEKHLRSLTRGPVVCDPKEIDHYGRTIARCRAGERDLSCAMISDGFAVRRYGNIWCL